MTSSTASPTLGSDGNFPLSGAAFYGMKIERVQQTSINVIEVETTGAIYRLDPNKLEMTRKIDPATNSINPRLVASLEFSTALQSIQVVSAHSEECVIQCDTLEFAFQSDSLFFVTNTSAVSVEYQHINSIVPVPWDKEKSNEPWSRMWTDGYGGSLHALATGTVHADTTTIAQSTHFTLASDSSMAHMVFPAREFDFERLYGLDAKPHDTVVYNLAQLKSLVNHIGSNPTFIDDNFLGAVVGVGALKLGEPRRDWLINHADLYDYAHLWNRAALPPDEIKAEPGQPTPVATAFYKTMDSLHPGKTPPYTFEQYINRSSWALFSDQDKVELRAHISVLHQHGLKFLITVQGYLMWLPDPHKQLVIDWLQDLKKDYNYDGFYFDNGVYGKNDEHGAWRETYHFFKKLRKALGEDIFILHHNSVDVWDGRTYSGVRAIMVDTYSDATYAGEVGTLAVFDEPGDSYLRHFSAGYGTTQVIAHHKRSTTRQGAFSEEEKVRAMASNLNGANRAAFGYIRLPTSQFHIRIWAPYLNFYQERRNQYQTQPSTFNYDVDWPPAWFQPVSNLQVTAPTATSVIVSWDTPPVGTDHTVTILNESLVTIPGEDNPRALVEWWKDETAHIFLVDTDDVPAGVSNPEMYIRTKYRNDPLQTNHSVEFTGLEAGSTYRLRIRSSNRLSGSQELVFGYAGTFDM